MCSTSNLYFFIRWVAVCPSHLYDNLRCRLLSWQCESYLRPPTQENICVFVVQHDYITLTILIWRLWWMNRLVFQFHASLGGKVLSKQLLITRLSLRFCTKQLQLCFHTLNFKTIILPLFCNVLLTKILFKFKNFFLAMHV